MTADVPDRRRSRLTLAITSVAVFMVSIEITIISLALPEIRAAFPHASESTLSWVITAYNIGVASLLLTSGWLADRSGRRRLFLIGLGVFAVGSLGAGLAISPTMLITARVVQSVGGALQFPAGLALLFAAFPPNRVQVAVGIWAGMGGLAAATGPTLGALLVEGLGWRAIFLFNVPIAALGLVAGLRWLDESVSQDIARRVDVLSVPMASIGVGMAILGMVQGRSWGWGSWPVIGSFAAAALLIAGFVARSRTHPAPLFDLGLFRLRTFAMANLGTVAFAAAFFSWLVLLPTYIQNVWGWSVLETGFAIAPGPLVSSLVSPVSGRLANRCGHAPLLVVAGISGATGLGLQLLLLDTTPGYVSGLLVPGLLIGLAAGLGFAQLVAASMREVSPARYAMAGAGRTTVFQLTTALGIALAFTLVGRPDGPDALLAGMQRTWWFGLGAYLALAVIFAFFYPSSTTERANHRSLARPRVGA
ncbi:MAG: DHA2 family efflux MFS transporter permease subunit [Acidimicrobiales bacterium]